MPTIEEKIKDAEEKLKKMKLQKAQSERAKKTKEAKKARSEETRKKILLGSYYMTKMEDEESKKKILWGLDKYLTRADDRALFGLPPLQTPAPSA
ncbi:MAG: mobilization protein [Gammaproteobacteria bacterium]|nr:mobilization protein [Gammaproteobacteria bacterium]